MLLEFPIFYRNYGLRRVEQLMAPRFGRLQNFQLPRQAIFHSAHGAPNQYGPADNDVALQGFSAAIMKENRIIQKAQARNIWVHHITKIARGYLGAPINQSIQPLAVIRQYHQRYKRFRNAPTDQALADVASLMVVNYQILPHMVRYPRGQFNAYLEWYNIERTVWTEVARLATLTDRPQFVMCHLPQVLPPRSMLQQYEKMEPTRPMARLLHIFYDNAHLMLGELWKWLGQYRHDSLIGLVPREHLKKVNLVFLESGRWTTVNLGMLDAWRKPLKDELLPNEEIKNNLLDPLRFQNRLLRFFMAITQLRSAAPILTDAERQVLDADDRADIKQALTTVTKVSSTPAAIDPITQIAKVDTAIVQAEIDGAPDNDQPDDTPDSVKVDERLDAVIDAELAEMEKVVTPALDADDPTASQAVDKRQAWVDTPMAVEVPVPSLERPSHAEALLNIAKRNLTSGTITAAQYRNYERVASAYKTMASPVPKMTVEEFITIPPETLKINASATIPDIATVPDKTMLKSSLLDFDRRYVKDVMQRDVAAMVMCFAQAGYGVTAYEVEPVESLMGSYNIYTVRVLPTDGTASTIRFKLPVINEDGSYLANGVSYSLRKQRVD